MWKELHHTEINVQNGEKYCIVKPHFIIVYSSLSFVGMAVEDAVSVKLIYDKYKKLKKIHN